MAKFITTKEASAKWGITESRINVLCKEGRIPGVYKENKRWVIPADVSKPADKRLKQDKRISRSGKKVADKSDKKLTLPIGISDYRKASSEYYYVDKAEGKKPMKQNMFKVVKGKCMRSGETLGVIFCRKEMMIMVG